MLDKILGKKDNDKKDTPDLHKNGKKSESDMGGRLKDMVGKVSVKANDTFNGKDENKGSSDKKIPRPMPKPKPKPLDKPRLRSPETKKKSGFGGGGFGRKIPDDDDQRTLVGAAVVGIILIVLGIAAYYFIFYSPYQDSLNNAKMEKINETNSYFTGPLATDSKKLTLLAQIDAGVTPEQVLAVDVMGPATSSWRTYQKQQIVNKTDPYGRVMITYTANDQKNLLMNNSSAQTIVNEADASVLSKMEINTPDTVAVPIMISRLQAAGGLINVGDSVDVYLNTNASTSSTNESNQTSSSDSPNISGATVLAILRATDSGAIDANLTEATASSSGSGYMATQSSSTDVEQLLRAASSGTWNDSQVSAVLSSYGWKLSDFERESNLGDLDAEYLIVLEVPRENALFLIQNMNSVVLTVPTSSAPEWMITELKSIYG
ncbi:MAG: RcpC/CpaB family pilus assembly protein [Methanobacterium paludis]|uniref:Uncharacterized protein n=1 Tax=Methanobacterium paludis (strain DSM 25820 / JCM 18151 / SWAN1) TaxID=868131 RepID=F6D1X3_METPW|nr:RcpC/CpaB family pilus assembly protein [Methanobacterium paludis]AEG17262.1 protein of unknown function DUF515 [Methanobacterium paludis]MCE7699487.1 RcpC/CpaB family pilus assembly protein [Methanobacterium paludis]